MIAAAVVCVAALSQAATFEWDASKIYYSVDAAELTKLVDGKVYDAATSGTGNRMKGQEGTVAWKMIMTITDAAGTEELDPVAISGYSSNKPFVTGLSSDKVFKPATDTDPTCQFAYSVVIKGTLTDASGNEWTLTSNKIDCGDVEIGALDELVITAPNSAIPTKWTASGTSAVPEPTSAMLLLLGVAGLALRRRRA